MFRANTAAQLNDFSTLYHEVHLCIRLLIVTLTCLYYFVIIVQFLITNSNKNTANVMKLVISFMLVCFLEIDLIVAVKNTFFSYEINETVQLVMFGIEAFNVVPLTIIFVYPAHSQ